MKKFLFNIFILFTLLSCGMTPEKTVDNFLFDIKHQKIESAVKLTTNPELVKNLKHTYRSNVQKTIFDILYDNFEYKVVNSTETNEKTVIVNVEIENIDVQDILYKVFQRSLKSIFNGDKNLDIEKEINEIIKEGDLKKQKTIDQYVLVKKGREYKIDISTKNIDNIFGTYYSSMSNIYNIGR